MIMTPPTTMESKQTFRFFLLTSISSKEPHSSSIIDLLKSASMDFIFTLYSTVHSNQNSFVGGSTICSNSCFESINSSMLIEFIISLVSCTYGILRIRDEFIFCGDPFRNIPPRRLFIQVPRVLSSHQN
jgi:hypothetical protein